MTCSGVVGTHHGSVYWLNIEPCGLICGMITWLLVGYSMFAFPVAVILPWMGASLHAYTHILIFYITSLMSVYSHIKAMTTDPGAVPRNAKPLLDDEEEFDMEADNRNEKFRKYCKRCKAFKPLRAHHCSICGRCIVKMDHHCPWVNNCVGLGNHKLFIAFLVWINVSCCYSLILIVAKTVACYSVEGDECGTPEHSLYTIFLLLESILFGLFTFCMIADQLSVVTSNQTQIDRLKNEKYEIDVDINEVFGSPLQESFRLSWVLPFAVTFPENCRDKILGYCVHYDNCSNSNNSELDPLTSSNTIIGGISSSSSDHHPRQQHLSLLHDRLKKLNSSNSSNSNDHLHEVEEEEEGMSNENTLHSLGIPLLKKEVLIGSGGSGDEWTYRERESGNSSNSSSNNNGDISLQTTTTSSSSSFIRKRIGPP